MTDKYREYPCDVCGSDEAEEIPSLVEYTGGYPIHVCKNCGFVYVKKRRAAEEIAKEWSERLFGQHFTARIPYMKARHVFLAEVLDVELGLKGKKVCDIGAGEGQFLDIIRQPEYGAIVFGIEPSAENGKLMEQAGIPHFVGTIEDYSNDKEAGKNKFDIITMMWTLENCESPKRMLNAAYDTLEEGGYVLLATSSRILVPFKKPLHYYIADKEAADTHSFRFSANTQRGILAETGFELAFSNRFIDHDVLCMIGKKTDKRNKIAWEKDNYLDVIDFFERWSNDTKTNFAHV